MNHSLKSWLLPGFFCCFTTAFMVICIKLVGSNFTKETDDFKSKLRILVMCSWSILIIVGILGLISLIMSSSLDSFQCDIKNIKKLVKSKPQITLFLLLVALLIFFTQFSMFYSVNFSPNIGYAHLVINLNVIITLLIGYFFFKGHINTTSALGAILSLVGISLVIYGSCL